MAGRIHCSGNTISKITTDGTLTTFADGPLFNCPNGLTIDPDQNLYACNFSDGKVLKITPDGTVSVFVELPVLSGGPNLVGNGHLTYDNGYLYITLIGLGQVQRICVEKQTTEFIAGVSPFSNTDGASSAASFSRPNGIIMSITGDTLFVNCSENSWISGPEYQPNLIRMVTGINGLPTDSCAVAPPLSISDQLAGLTLFEIFPNPILDHTILLTYKLEGVDSLQILLYDSNGRLLQTHTSMNLGRFSMTVPSLSAGIYVVKLETESGSISKKITIQ